MQELQLLIDKFISWGSENISTPEENKLELERSLVCLYKAFLDINNEFINGGNLKEPPTFDYEKIKKFVSLNFPQFGYYNSLLETDPNIIEPGLGIGDAIDDLSDIIEDLMKVKWRFDNTSENNALWNFHFHFQAHGKFHVINLLQYLQSKVI